MMSSETDEIIEELFESLLQSYQEELEESIDGIYLVFGKFKLRGIIYRIS